MRCLIMENNPAQMLGKEVVIRKSFPISQIITASTISDELGDEMYRRQ